ncbi:hypothetical protein C5167_014392 [Papaver somniferum]|uniref:Acyl-CoA-binding domain-containing protein n=1 Tax=Papaver somniferum TaxID=3469 RepID=A0A4Y7J317_PAPSO|nr:hypothetical protein C5167_014392 [Papaver somniferum]
MKKMFGFSRRRMKLGRLKVQLSDTNSGTRSPVRHTKRNNKSDGESVTPPTKVKSDVHNRQSLSDTGEPNSCASGSAEGWMVLSTTGDKPTPRFNHATTVIGDKMVVVGGESGHGVLDDVQVLSFERFTWTKASSKLYLSPNSLPLKIPACKGHRMVPWGKKALMIGGKTDPASDRISVWAFDIETECWSLMEARGEIPVSRSGHSVTRAGSVLILFGGEDAKGRKLNDIHMFDLKSLMWLPLHYTGSKPSPRSNHVAALYDDRILFIFGGSSKSRTLNDLYSLDFETMIWTRIKLRGFHPSPRAGSCGILCGNKWYIAGGGSKKKRHADTLVLDVLKLEWSVAVASSPSSITSTKGFSLVFVHHKEKDFLVAFGGYKKETSNQIEVLVMERHDSMGWQSTGSKCPGEALFENFTLTIGFACQFDNRALPCPVDSVVRNNIASVLENHGSGRKSISVSSLMDSNPLSSLSTKCNKDEGRKLASTMRNNLLDENFKETDNCSVRKNSSSQTMEQHLKTLDTGVQTDLAGGVNNVDDMSSVFDSENYITHHQNQISTDYYSDKDEIQHPETEGKPVGLFQMYETKIAGLIRKNGLLEGQLTTALTSKEAAEKNLSSVVKSKQDMEKKLSDTVKEMELLKEKLSSIEIAQDEANSLSNIFHSDNVRLEHDVAFLKAVLDDTQKELNSTRGVLTGERARAFQLQVEVFHLKQRLQSIENRAPTPRKPFHMQ